jgi:hypothetical protein
MSVPRASVFNRLQIGVEAVSGTPVSALKLLQALTLTLGPKTVIETFGPDGEKFDTTSVLNEEWTEGKIGGPISYNELPYLLSSHLGAATISTASGESTWVWVPLSSSPDAAKSFTVEQGGGPRAHRVPYVMVPDLSLKFGRKACSLDGAVFGQALTDGIYMSTSELVTLTKGGTWSAGTFTLTYGGQTTTALAFNATAAAIQAALEALSSIGPGNVVCAGGPISTTAVTVQFTGALGALDAGAITYDIALVTGSSPTLTVTVTTPGVAPTTIPLIPLAGTHWTVAVADTYADLTGGTGSYLQLARPLSFEWSQKGRYAPVFVGNGQTSFVTVVEKKPTLEAMLETEANAEGMGLLTTMRANATKYVRLKAQGATINTNPYLLQIDMAARVKEPKEFADEDGLYKIGYGLTLVKDSNIGSAHKWTVRNTLAAL